MKETLFEKIFAKYGYAITKNLYKNQINALEKAFADLEKGKRIYIDDPFTKITFDLIMCDLKHERRCENE